MIGITAVVAAAAFNLSCVGTEVNGPFTLSLFVSPDKKPFSATYRVDSDEGRWCLDACSITFPLAALSTAEITFQRQPAEGDPKIGRTVLVSREAGLFTDVMIIGPRAIIRSATCKKTQFTGFPALKF